MRNHILVVAALLFAGAVRADVRYVSVPQTELRAQVPIDLDGDGAVDLTFDILDDCPCGCFAKLNASTGGGIVSDGVSQAVALKASAEIGPTSTFAATSSLASGGGTRPLTGALAGTAEPQFLGVRFRSGGADHFAWLRVKRGRCGVSMVPVDYAFETTADRPIAIGAGLPAAGGSRTAPPASRISITSPGPTGGLSALTYWDPDGEGPQRSRLVATGNFEAEHGCIPGVYQQHPVTGRWSSLKLETFMATSLQALAALPDGSLVLGGSFTTVGRQPARHIARWSGGEWSPLGTGIADGNSRYYTSGSVSAMVVLPSGDLVAAGRFGLAAGANAVNIARFDGKGWSSIAAGADEQAVVFALLLLPNGDLLAAGHFESIGGTRALNIARWNGAVWSSMGSGLGGQVRALALLPSGDVIAGGRFSRAGQRAVFDLARWDGSSWSQFGKPVEYFRGLHSWSGTAWVPTGPPAPDGTMVHSLLVLRDGHVVAGGSFQRAGDIIVNGLARWNGTVWSRVSSPITLTRSTVQSIGGSPLQLVSGALIIGGYEYPQVITAGYPVELEP